MFTCNPVLGGKNKVGNKILDVNCMGIPAFGQSGPFTSPQYIRMPNRSNWDLTLFKNFKLGEGNRKIQFRFGAFYIFNQAVPGTLGQDIDLRLDTQCNVRVNGVAPGAIAWPDDGQFDPAERGRILASTPLGHVGRPEDIAQAVHFLACAPYITGQIVAVDGGRSIFL